ncbi:ATP-dependent RNA helicase DHX33 [Galendromus occidentalis]|uniref:RNA helicase n=1 Tax=Galendromus occidentalis TaxID=34638 RepID=A0AAJ7PB89_9ACAR|nr:ATP-dependent RNA helicase DHX33 [Galendromus occidentalis]
MRPPELDDRRSFCQPESEAELDGIVSDVGVNNGHNRSNDSHRQNGHSNGFGQKPSVLPVVEARWKILRHIRSRDVSIIVSETASGKTTEIPKILFEGGFCGKYSQGGAIAITQPRRVAATSVARYVAKSMKCQLGSLVGYSVRFDDVTSNETKIKYLTDGMLLRESLDDPDLMRYSTVILDEAHERTVNSDVLCSLLKKLQAKRKQMSRPLRLIIMSATVNPEIYVKFFKLQSEDIFFLRGRQYQVQLNYTAEVQEDYVSAALVTVLKIIRLKDSGDILVFCTGQEEIESMVKSCNELGRSIGADFKAMPLYSALPQSAQEKVLTPLPDGARKIIFATNIAEASITIPGVNFVVDTCRMKCRHYNPTTGIEILRVEKISQAQAWQRSGRAGRVSDGECFRLITAGEFNALKQFPVAEIRRCSLSSVIMSLIALKQDVKTFAWLESPPDETVKQALQTLALLEATKVDESDALVLTRLGSMMRRFPLEPAFSRCIFGAKSLSCVEPMLTIIAMLSCDGSPIATSRRGSDDSTPVTVRQFGTNEGDLIMYLNIFTKYNQADGNKEWCDANGVNRKTLCNVKKIRSQLRDVCGQLSLSLTKSTNDNIRRALVTGLFRNIAYRVKANQYRTLESKRDVTIHPSSCLFRQNPDVVVFTEVVKTSNCYIRNVTPIDIEWYNSLAPKDYTQKYPIPLSSDD